MQHNKPLILHLLQQDLRHNQLLPGLENLQLHSGGCYELDIRRTVAQLMGMPQGHIPDRFLQLYDALMQESQHVAPSEQPEAFKLLALYCYEQLCRIGSTT